MPLNDLYSLTSITILILRVNCEFLNSNFITSVRPLIFECRCNTANKPMSGQCLQFIPPEKYLKTKGFLVFSGGYKMRPFENTFRKYNSILYELSRHFSKLMIKMPKQCVNSIPSATRWLNNLTLVLLLLTSPAKMFFSEYFEIFKNTYFEDICERLLLDF